MNFKTGLLLYLFLFLLTLLPVNAQTADELVDYGNKLYSQGKYKEAIEYYDGALRLDPQNIRALCNEGNSYYALGNYSKSIICYDLVLNLDPGNSTAATYKQKALQASGKTSGNTQGNTQGNTVDQNRWEYWYYRSKELMQQGKYSEASQCNSKALELASKQGGLDKLESLLEQDVAYYQGKRADAQKDVCTCGIKNILTALSMYKMDYGCYPDSLNTLLKPGKDGHPYMRSLSYCPVGKKDYVYKKINNNNVRVICPVCGTDMAPTEY
ncbi:MAG: tetratricopeptide repeat protein [Candidatus Eremiobacterota bacterium]